MTRPFRTEESIHAEKITRDAVAPFLAACGFQDIDERRHVAGSAITQLIESKTPHGQRVIMRVRLCWRRRSADDLKYSAAQLRARLINNDWEETLEKIMRRDLEQGVSHNLILQRDGAVIAFAALIPSKELKGIFDTQAQVSQKLIDSQQMNNLKKNHAKNGSSPTVWLMDERTPAAHQVPDVLWNWPGVVNLLKLPLRVLADDDDVMELGIKMGDRVWNCVALCPNCHRDAHYSPESDSINLDLLQYAEQFNPVNKEDEILS